MAGQPFETIKDWSGVDQLDVFDAGLALTLRRAGTSVNLETLSLP